MTAIFLFVAVPVLMVALCAGIAWLFVWPIAWRAEWPLPMEVDR